MDGTTCNSGYFPQSVAFADGSAADGRSCGAGDCNNDPNAWCYDDVSFHQAAQICRDNGERLCTQAEVESGVCCGTGCMHNHHDIWFSDAANPSPPFDGWGQWEVDMSKCNNNQNLVCVDSHEECQGVAVANGHDWYSFRHNIATNNECNGRHKCFSSSHCDNGLIGDRVNDWKIYKNRPSILVAEDTKCPHLHQDRLFRSPDAGSNDITLAECYDLCDSTDGCNHYSWGAHEGGFVCMGCTSLTNAQGHDGFTAYDMPGLTRYTLDGCGADGADLLPLTGSADPAATADVRCCSLDGSSGVSQDFEGGEDYFRPGATSPHSTGCAFGRTFLEARGLCDARGMRLCRPHEVDVTCGSGCWHNHNAVWVDVPTVGVTIDGCSTDNSNHSPDQYPGSDDSQALIPSSQKEIGDTAAVRCCSYDGSDCESNNGDADGVGGAGCNDAVSFVDAQRICSEVSKRLCSADEMDTCCGTGCWYNHFGVWTSSGL